MTTLTATSRFLLVVPIFFFILAISPPANANLLTNSSFKDGVAGWDTSGVPTSLSYGSVSNCWWVHSGDKSMNLTPTDLQINSSIRQNLSGLAAGDYEFGVYTRISSVEPVANWDQIQVSVIGSGIDVVAGTDPNAVRNRIGVDGVFATTDWVLLSGVFTAGPGASALLNINFQNYSDALTGAIVDDAFVRSVPEPGNLVLMALGITFISLLSRKRKLESVKRSC
jgi:hypothetical protein